MTEHLGQSGRSRNEGEGVKSQPETQASQSGRPPRGAKRRAKAPGLGQGERSTSARGLPMHAPRGWDLDLWREYRFGLIYEQEVPRDMDGEPLFDADGNPTRGRQ